MRSRALSAVLLAGWAALPFSLPASWPRALRPHLPVWAERWLYNPGERTAAAIEAYRKGDGAGAAAAADSALRLAPSAPEARVNPNTEPHQNSASAPQARRSSDTAPLAHFNSGTAHLAAGDKRKAVEHLQEAAKEAGPELSAAAHYNLGNARLAAGDNGAAVEAYKQALRAEPANADAKFNLELALRGQQQDRLRARSPREGSKGDRSGGPQPSARGAGRDDRADTQPRRGDASDPGRSPRAGQGQAPGPPQGPPGHASRQPGQPLPGYQDQPEMSAREAAAVLAAVDNLERQQRRNVAARLARQRATRGEDW
jgi:Ca-activated chloride channel family protein